MLEVQALERRYGARVALAGVSLTVQPGEIVGLLGANGAGKSTLLRTVAGLQPPDAGHASVCGHDVWRAPETAKRFLGYAAEEPSFHEELSALEYLAFVSAVRGLEPESAHERTLALAGRLELEARLDEPVRGFSHGMRKKLSFMAAVLHEPEVLLCDEALEGFDAPSALAAKSELRRLAARGAAVLFSSHVTETVERLCDRVVMLHEGRVARSLTRAEWGAGDDLHSPLERLFLEILGPPAPTAPSRPESLPDASPLLSLLRYLLPTLLLSGFLPDRALAGAIAAPPAILAMWNARDGAAVRDSLRGYAARGEAAGADVTKRMEGGEAAWWLGVQDARAGRADSALAQWRRAWTLRGDFDEGFALGDALARRGRKADVDEAHDVAAVLADQSRVGMPRRAPEAFARLAWTLHLRGRTDSAIAIAREWCGPIQHRPMWTRRLVQIQLAAGDTAVAWPWLVALSARTRGQHPETEALLKAAQRSLHYTEERRVASVGMVRDPVDASEKAFVAGLNARFDILHAPDGFAVRYISVPATAGRPRQAHVLFVLSPTDTLPAADSLAASLAAAGHPVTLVAPRGCFGALGAGVTGPEVWAGREGEWFTATAADAGRVMDEIAKKRAPAGGWIVGAAGDMAPVALSLARSRKNVRAMLLAAPHLPLVEVAEYRARLKTARTRTFIQVGPEEPLSLETADLISRETLPGQVRVADSGAHGKGAALFRGGPLVMQRFYTWLAEKPAKP